MKYRETKAQSGEILRLIIPLMAKFEAPFHPPSYAVWYEYLTGVNPALKQVLDPLVNNPASVDTKKIEELYANYIAGPEAATNARMQAEMRRVMDEMSEYAADAEDQAVQYGDALGAYGAKLQRSGDANTVTNVVQALLADTERMQDSVTTLQSRLEASSREATELREALQRAQGEAYSDALTGLTNRRGFEKVVEDALKNPNGLSGYSLLMADIDHFKKVNDTHGHLFGDKVIRSVAHVLKACVKGRDTAARFGGEEFAVLLPDTPLSGARALAEHIRATIEKGRIRRPDSSEEVGTVTISIGIASYVASDTIETLIQRADLALYAAKKAGRNRVMTQREDFSHEASASRMTGTGPA
jgi:diguanylate cyclase